MLNLFELNLARSQPEQPTTSYSVLPVGVLSLYGEQKAQQTLTGSPWQWVRTQAVQMAGCVGKLAESRTPLLSHRDEAG